MQALVKEGHEVTVLHRKRTHKLGKKVGNIQCDRNDGEAVKKALSAHKFEVVFDNAYDWERGTTSAQVEACVKAAGDRLTRYVFMSSVAAYGDGLNHHEADALAPDDHPDPYVRNKAMAERMLFRMYHRSKTPVVTLRPPFVFGPENPFYREAFFWDRMPAEPAGDPAGGRPAADAVHLREGPGVGGGEGVGRAGRRGPGVQRGEPAAGDAGGTAASAGWGGEEEAEHHSSAAAADLPARRASDGSAALLRMYYDLPAITQVVAKAQRTLGWKPTDFGKALGETYRWYLRNHKRPKTDWTFEDKLVEAAATAPVNIEEFAFSGMGVSAMTARRR